LDRRSARGSCGLIKDLDQGAGSGCHGLAVVIEECGDVEEVELAVAVVIGAEITVCQGISEGENIIVFEGVVVVVVCGVGGGSEDEDLVGGEVGVGVE